MTKGNIPIYIHLLNSFKLSYIAIYDKDHQNYKDESGINSADICSRNIEDAINSNYGTSVVLENDIEEEIGITDQVNKHKAYLALETIANPSFVLTAQLTKKIRLIYDA